MANEEGQIGRSELTRWVEQRACLPVAEPTVALICRTHGHMVSDGLLKGRRESTREGSGRAHQPDDVSPVEPAIWMVPCAYDRVIHVRALVCVPDLDLGAGDWMEG